MELTSENVKSTLSKLFYTEAELASSSKEALTKEAIVVDGLKQRVGFKPSAVEAEKANIASMLDQLPRKFHQSGGGGWSFLNACDREDGVQWTDFHKDMDELFMLGTAAGYARPVLPRNMWNVFPGGMPYFVVATPPDSLDSLVNESGKEEKDGSPI